MDEIEKPIDRPENTSTRGSFLKRLGITLAAGVGVAAAFASGALADPNRCCTDCAQCGNQGCAGTACHCHCDCSGIGESYCWFAGPCTTSCINCPC